MDESTDQQLLRDYIERQSDAAFAAVVHRYVDLVYSTAFRILRESHAAKDVSQSVFVVLASEARQLIDRPALAGWLYTTTRNLTAKTVRSEVRRRAREQEAAVMNELLSANPEVGWEHIAPHLDAALDELSDPDREALLLRYFKNHDLRTVGATLGISDDAAQKRVSRAVERLREFFVKRGVGVGASGLTVVISAHAVQAAPAGLAVAISTASALAGTTLVTATVTASKAIAMTTVQKTLVTATMVALAGVGVYEARQALQMRDQVQTLQQQQAPLSDQIAQLNQALMDATNRFAALSADNERLNLNRAELLKLRGEAGALRQGNNDAAKLNAEIALLRQKISQLEGMWINWTNSTHFNNPFFSREAWEDRGTDEPLNTLQSMLGAIKRGDDTKLAQLVSREDDLQSVDSLLMPKRVWDKVTGVQIVDIGIISDARPQRKAIIGTILQHQLPPSASPSGSFDNPVLQDYSSSKQTMRRWFFVETNGHWLITGGG